MIRKYKEEDIPALVNIWEQATTIAHSFLKEDFTTMVKKMMYEEFLPNSDTWVYEHPNGDILGFISMMGNEIGGLFVLPESQGRGIGSQLLQHISASHKTLEVEVFNENKIGKPFYEKQGFKVIKSYIHEMTNQKVLCLSKNVTKN